MEYGPPFDVRRVANTILDIADMMGLKLTNLSLQKIVFFSHAYHLVELGGPLIDEKFEAWQYGPVSRTLYQCFKHLDSKPIDERAKGLDPKTLLTKSIAGISEANTFNFLESVVGFFGRVPAGTLVELSHEIGSPWEVVWKTNQQQRKLRSSIPDEMILSYYSHIPRPIRRECDAYPKNPTRH